MQNDSSSENELPEDIDRWPMDPETLLGVASDVSRRDLKRAYTRRIRQYKPEHAPEQFRRLRDAYEKLDRELAWKEEFLLRHRLESEPDEEVEEVQIGETPASDPVEPVTPIRASATDTENDSVAGDPVDHAFTHQDDIERSKLPVSEMNADQLWQLALDGGDLKPVYLGLLVHVRRRRATEIEFARLYWLLTLASDLEPERDPCSWLVEGLRRYGEQRTRLYQMLEIEVRRRGGFVPLVLEDELFDGNHSVRRLVDLAGTRWYAARRLGRYDVIADDFERLKRRFIDEPDEWLRFVSTGLRSLLLTHSEIVVAILRQELDQLPANTSHNWIWDSLEFDLQLHDAWRDRMLEPISLGTDFHDIIRSLLTVLESTWDSSASDSRIAVLDFCRQLMENPVLRLKDLSHIEQKSRPLMRRLMHLIDEQQQESKIDSAAEMTPALDQELRRFVRDTFHTSENAGFHVTVLNFCLREAVTPHDIADALNRMEVAVPDSYFEVAERLTGNLSLNCLVNAHRLLW